MKNKFFRQALVDYAGELLQCYDLCVKYKVVGILDIVFSSLFLITQLGLIFFVYPKMYQLYSKFNVQLPFITRYFYFFSFAFILIYLTIFVVGIKLLKSQNQKLFVLGVIALVMMFVFSGYFIVTSVLGAINPIYDLSNNL